MLLSLYFFSVKILNVNFYKLIANVLFVVNSRKFMLRKKGVFFSRAKFFLSRVKTKKEMQSENCISSFVRRMRLELTRPCDHYPLKVACIPISPPAQGLFEKLSGKRDSNPRPQPWQGCALPTELFPQNSLNFARFLLCSV